MVSTRSDQLKSQVEEAKQLRLEADAKLKEVEERLRSFETEAATMLKNAKEDSEKIRARIFENANQMAQKIVQEAEATAAANIQEFKNEIRREVIEKAVEAAERLIREKMSPEDRRRIITDYVEQV